jgi:hypothetical protein
MLKYEGNAVVKTIRGWQLLEMLSTSIEPDDAGGTTNIARYPVVGGVAFAWNDQFESTLCNFIYAISSFSIPRLFHQSDAVSIFFIPRNSKYHPR